MAEYQSGGGELFELFKNFDAQGITSTVDNISDFFLILKIILLF